MHAQFLCSLLPLQLLFQLSFLIRHTDFSIVFLFEFIRPNARGFRRKIGNQTEAMALVNHERIYSENVPFPYFEMEVRLQVADYQGVSRYECH